MKMPLIFEQKGKLMEYYFGIKSIVQTQRRYQCHFAVRKAPGRKTICRITNKFQIERTFHNINKERSGQIRGVSTPANTD